MVGQLPEDLFFLLLFFQFALDGCLESCHIQPFIPGFIHIEFRNDVATVGNPPDQSVLYELLHPPFADAHAFG